MKESKNRKDTIEYPDAPSGAIKLYKYKEPFMDTPNGYGYLGVLMHDAERDLIQCHVCGEWFSRLQNHIQTHGFKNVRQYKNEFGLAPSTALIADGLREIMIENGKNQLNKGKINLKALEKGRRKPSGVHYKMSTEVRNNRGTCPLQLLDKLDKIKEEIGHTPTHAEVWKIKSLDGKYFSGRGLLRSIEYTHGSWENAVAQLQWTGVDRKKNEKRRYWTKESLLEAIRQFVIKNKRIPTSSDAKRGVFPRHGLYRKDFGGFENAKKIILDDLINNYTKSL